MFTAQLLFKTPWRGQYTANLGGFSHKLDHICSSEHCGGFNAIRIKSFRCEKDCCDVGAGPDTPESNEIFTVMWLPRPPHRRPCWAPRSTMPLHKRIKGTKEIKMECDKTGVVEERFHTVFHTAGEIPANPAKVLFLCQQCRFFLLPAFQSCQRPHRACSCLNITLVLSENVQQKGREEQEDRRDNPEQHLRRRRPVQPCGRWACSKVYRTVCWWIMWYRLTPPPPPPKGTSGLTSGAPPL